MGKRFTYESSLEYFAKINNKEYLLEEYSVKNENKPDEIFKSSTNKYWWNCPNCKSEYDMSVDSRTCKKSSNCPYCAGKRVNETNCLWTTNPEIAKLLVNEQIGYNITFQSNTKTDFKCEHCDYILKDKYIYQITNQGFCCAKCSDGLSYPEKFMASLLSQFNMDFITEKSFDWSKNIKHDNKKLSGLKRYDFYIPSFNMIIETHGGQHYLRGFETVGSKTLELEQQNDNLKEKLAKENGIKYYIIIDCRRSELEFIKNKIIESDISKLFDLKFTDWLMCHEYACNSLVKTACELWNKGINSTVKIGSILSIGFATVIKYLKQGAELGWCNYNPKEVMKENGYMHKGKKRNKKWGKPVVRLNLEGLFIDEFMSATEAGKKLKFASSHISSVCNGFRKSAGGFKWMFKEDYQKLNNKEESNV
jgi:hypothetical protein